MPTAPSAVKYSISTTLLGVGEDIVKRKGNQKGRLIRRGKSWIVCYSRWVADESGDVAYKPTTATLGRAIGAERITKAEARAEAAKIVAEANGVAKVPQGLATVRQFVDLRFTPDRLQKMKLSGRKHYGYILGKHVMPSIGDLQMREITPSIIQTLINAKAEAGYSQQTVLHVRNAISGIFTHAKRLGFYRGDLPTFGIEVNIRRRQERRALTWAQVKDLAAMIGQPHKHRPLLILLATTGLRIGEAVGLRWKWVNLADDYKVVENVAIPPNSIAVRESFYRGEWGEPKTERGCRIIPLPSSAWVELQLWRDWLLTSGAVPQEENPVFMGRTGKPWDEHNVAADYLKPAARKIGAPWVSWHCFRHTAATLGDAAGLTPSEKQALLGHATTAMGNTYTHPTNERIRAAMERVDKGTVQ